MTVDKVKQHSGAIWLGKREHFIRNCSLKLDVLDELCRCADGATVIDSGLALLTSNLPATTGMDKISHDACKPRSERLIYVGLSLHRDKPRILRNIVRHRSVLDEGARELTNPSCKGSRLMS